MKSYKQYLAEAARTKPLIVYHSTNKPFDKFDFDMMNQRIIWFTNDKDGLLKREKGAAGSDWILTMKVNIKNPAGWDEYEKYGLSELEQMGYDGAILPDNDNTFDGFVFKNKQVKIIDKEKVK